MKKAFWLKTRRTPTPSGTPPGKKTSAKRRWRNSVDAVRRSCRESGRAEDGRQAAVELVGRLRRGEQPADVEEELQLECEQLGRSKEGRERRGGSAKTSSSLRSTRTTSRGSRTARRSGSAGGTAGRGGNAVDDRRSQRRKDARGGLGGGGGRFGGGGGVGAPRPSNPFQFQIQISFSFFTKKLKKLNDALTTITVQRRSFLSSF